MLDFGYCLPIFPGGNDRMARTPMVNSLNPKTLEHIVKEIDKMDFNSIWVADHLNMNHETPILEGLTTLSWASNISKRLRLGHIHYNNLLRNPSLTAKMYSTLDVITKGRMNFFIDGGHPGTKDEVESYGYNFLSDTERIEQLEEAIKIVKLMWSQEDSSFQGNHYNIRKPLVFPKPSQNPHPPIWIGSLTESSQVKEWNKKIFQIIAKYADWWNVTPVGIEEYKETQKKLKGVFKNYDRDFNDLYKSVELEILIGKNEEDIKRIKEELNSNNPQNRYFGNWENWNKSNVSGNPSIIVSKLKEYIELGVTNFMLWFIDSPSTEGAKIFNKEVIPELRRMYD